MTILGIDPGTRQMGAVVLNGQTLLALGVHTLTNGHHPRDLIDQARRIVLSYIEEFSPEVVGIEKPLLMPTKRAALVSVIAQELHARSRDLGTRVVELSARDVRRIVVGNPFAKKFDVARVLVRSFPDLTTKLPKEPPHPVLGYKPRDRYWLHMFDALAVAMAARVDRLQDSPATPSQQHRAT